MITIRSILRKSNRLSRIILSAIVLLATIIVGVTVVEAGEAFSLSEIKLGANDGELDDRFGLSVDIDGDIMVVGAYREDQAGSDAGAAYIFQHDGASWVQQAKLVPDDPSGRISFGWSVAISGDTVVVGAPAAGTVFSSPGVVYVFAHDGSTWEQQAKLAPEDSLRRVDYYGFSVDIQGGTIVVGAPRDDSSTGSAFVYTRRGSHWVFDTQLVAADKEDFDNFGKSVAISDDADRVVIGSPGEDTAAPGGGAVYVFDHQGAAWSQSAKLTASDAGRIDSFGWRVAIDQGHTILVGSLGHDLEFTDTGAVYVFNHQGPSWVEQAKLVASDASRFHYFGRSVAIDGNIAVIGASNDHNGEDNAGSVYIFELTENGWLQIDNFTASDVSAEDYFGYGVAIFGNTVVVGSPSLVPSGTTPSSPGYVYVYE